MLSTEVVFEYDRTLEEEWKSKTLLDKWCEKYRGSFLFCEGYINSEQRLNRNHRSGRSMFGFAELYIGTKYLDAGYDALWAYLKGESEKNCARRCYNEAFRLLGASFGNRFLRNEHGGRPPDLLVFCPRTKRFRWVECKGRENLNDNQIRKFPQIEEHLSQQGSSALSHPTDEQLFPHLDDGHWIHIARARPV